MFIQFDPKMSDEDKAILLHWREAIGDGYGEAGRKSFPISASLERHPSGIDLIVLEINDRPRHAQAFVKLTRNDDPHVVKRACQSAHTRVVGQHPITSGAAVKYRSYGIGPASPPVVIYSTNVPKA